MILWSLYSFFSQNSFISRLLFPHPSISCKTQLESWKNPSRTQKCKILLFFVSSSKVLSHTEQTHCQKVWRGAHEKIIRTSEFCCCGMYFLYLFDRDINVWKHRCQGQIDIFFGSNCPCTRSSQSCSDKVSPPILRESKKDKRIPESQDITRRCTHGARYTKVHTGTHRYTQVHMVYYKYVHNMM